MDQRTLTDQCEIIAQALLRDLPKADKPLGAAARAAVVIVTELVLDIKRIAEASGPPVHRHFHCPDGSVLNAIGDTVRIEPWLPPEHDVAGAVERVARLLAKKESERQFNYSDAEPGCSAQLRWIDVNWQSFQDEAGELLAAALPGGGAK